MKKWLSFVLLFAAVLMTNVLVSCDDDPTVASVAGTYTGTDSLHSDKTINVTFPEETYDFSATVPMVGKIVQGGYTVKNIPYDSTLKAYYLDYSNKAQANVSIFGKNQPYDITVGQITVSFNGSTMAVINVHKFGNMPFALAATYLGTK